MALVMALAVAAGTAQAGGFIGRAVRARVHPPVAPVRVPPVPVGVTWKPVRIASLDLGAPLVALVGDKAMLYAVTAKEVVALGVANGKATELGRVAFSGELAVPAPREVVGAAVVDGDTVVASVSAYARSLRVHWKGKQLVAELGAPGFPTCGKELVPLVPGRNYLDGASYGARCRDLVDPTGAPLAVRAMLATTSRLTVTANLASHEYPAIGVAFELADVDRDGRPEVIVAGAGAPGDVDAVKVMTFPDDKPVFRKAFTGGVVGIATLDDGTGAVGVVAAVRLVGATRVDLWRLD